MRQPSKHQFLLASNGNRVLQKAIHARKQSMIKGDLHSTTSVATPSVTAMREKAKSVTNTSAFALSFRGNDDRVGSRQRAFYAGTRKTVTHDCSEDATK